ncbi:MAG: hypothetical protein EOO09_05785 [Chitinophagaceae bacterium]|nr:MAG: hypothetical protein EOO09_05785 [Chitinophagaceae bacterium]
MKKIFTIMLALGMVTFVSAQGKQVSRPGKQENIPVKTATYGRQAPVYSYSFNLRQRDAEISRINRQYDQKISIIQRSRSARTAAMGRKVRDLEQQRDAELRAVEARYSHTANIGRSKQIIKTGRSGNW